MFLSTLAASAEVAEKTAFLGLSGEVLAFIGAAFSVIFSCIGSSLGVRIAGEAAAGVVAEDSSKFGQCLLLQILPATQGIYGTIIAFYTMLKVGIFAGAIESVSVDAGLTILAGGLIMGVVGWISAVNQGRVSAAGIGIVAKRASDAAKGMIFAAMVETYAIFALLISFLLIFRVPLN